MADLALLPLYGRGRHGRVAGGTRIGRDDLPHLSRLVGSLVQRAHAGANRSPGARPAPAAPTDGASWAQPARAFAATCGAIVLMFCTLFIDLFPHAMVSSTNPAFSLTLNEASSSHYTLSVMTVVAVLFLPFVLLYQGWTYWVFRRRVSAEDFGAVRSPMDLLSGSQPEGDGGPAGA